MLRRLSSPDSLEVARLKACLSHRSKLYWLHRIKVPVRKQLIGKYVSAVSGCLAAVVGFSGFFLSRNVYQVGIFGYAKNRQTVGGCPGAGMLRIIERAGQRRRMEYLAWYAFCLSKRRCASSKSLRSQMWSGKASCSVCSRWLVALLREPNPILIADV